MEFESPVIQLRKADSPYTWVVRSLTPGDAGAMVVVQGRAPSGALEWSINEVNAALSSPWNDRVGYLSLGLCVSFDEMARFSEVQYNLRDNFTVHHNVGHGSRNQGAVHLKSLVFESPFSDFDEGGYGVEKHFDHSLGGFIILHIVDDEAEVQHLAVDSSLNGKGGGSALLEEALIRLAIREVRSVFLEVRASNTRALRLYERVGFRKVGVRAGYYADTGEDAIVMQYSL